MAKQEILLVKDVLKLGNMGDIIKVPPGYARNYLYPERLAIPASQAAKRQVEVLREKAAKSEAEREVKANAQKRTMEGMTVQVAARVAHELELFGSIGTKEIVAVLAKSGIEIDGKQVHLTDKIRRLGVYQIDVRLHRKVAVTIKLEVVNSDPNAPSLAETMAAYAAAREAKKSAKPEEAPASAEGEAKEAEAKPAKAEAKAEKTEKAAKPEKADKAAKGDKGDKPAAADKADKAGKKKQKG
jgi:large subunit ribosomal protein L9